MTENRQISKTIDLGQLQEYMPWKQVFEDLQYPMPYPEVVMAGELAYAQYTQMVSLLMMLSWEAGNKATFTLEHVDATVEAYILDIDFALQNINDGWDVVGITPERLKDYLTQAAASWAQYNTLSGKNIRAVRLEPNKWMLTVEANS